ncbi:MAG: flippase-like domain-containing protein [Balneolales bacterium]|nr:flippase-like domain-containing protein [Balneolales bacterium]
MVKRIIHLLIGLSIAAVFIWLSLREVDSGDVISELKSITYWWAIPFAFVVTIGNYIRAERWKMVLDDETGTSNSRVTLFSGLLYGLTSNMVIPRAGEVLRAVYVAKSTGIETTRLFGTIVSERLIDLFMMLLMLLVTFILLVTDQRLVNQIFGEDGAWYITVLTSTTGLLVIGAGFILTIGLIWYLRRRSARKKVSVADETERADGFVAKPASMMKSFVRGLISIRNLKNWPLFVLYTIIIWGGYILMSFLPFFAFGFPETFAFGWEQAFVITVIGAVGVMLPSPGGIGTFHYIVQQGMVVLYAVPSITALAYATVNHLANMITIIVLTLIFYLVNQFRNKNNKSSEIPFSELIR